MILQDEKRTVDRPPLVARRRTICAGTRRWLDRLGPSDDAGCAPAGTTVLSPAGLAAADAGASFASGFRADPSIAAPCRRSIWPQIGLPANAPGNMTPENALFANQATNRFLSGELSGEGGR
jgi:hypothetical protein